MSWRQWARGRCLVWRGARRIEKRGTWSWLDAHRQKLTPGRAFRWLVMEKSVPDNRWSGRLGSWNAERSEREGANAQGCCGEKTCLLGSDVSLALSRCRP